MATGMKVAGEEDQQKNLQVGEIQVAVMIGTEGPQVHLAFSKLQPYAKTQAGKKAHRKQVNHSIKEW